MKRILSLVLCLAMLLAVGCTSAPPAETKPAGSSDPAASQSAGGFDTKYEWSLATTYASGDSATLAYKKFAELVEEKTDGAVKVTVFSDGALGGENDTIQAISANELEFVGSGTGPVFLYTPEYSFLMGVFLFDTYEEYTNCWESSLMDDCRDILAKDYNIANMGGFGYRGYRNYIAGKKFTNQQEFAAAKMTMRMNSNPNWMESWNNLGSTCVTIALGELYSAMQNGTVQAAEGPWTQSTSIALQEVSDYVMETKHTFEGAAIWMNQKLYDSLPANYQEAVTAAMTEAMDYLDEIGPEMDAKELQKCLDAGCELVEIDRDSFVKAAEPYLRSCFESLWNVTTYDDVKAAGAGNYKK